MPKPPYFTNAERAVKTNFAKHVGSTVSELHEISVQKRQDKIKKNTQQLI